MLITLSCRTVICQSVAEVKLTGVAPNGAVSHRFLVYSQDKRGLTVILEDLSVVVSGITVTTHDL